MGLYEKVARGAGNVAAHVKTAPLRAGRAAKRGGKKVAAAARAAGGRVAGAARSAGGKVVGAGKAVGGAAKRGATYTGTKWAGASKKAKIGMGLAGAAAVGGGAYAVSRRKKKE